MARVFERNPPGPKSSGTGLARKLSLGDLASSWKGWSGEKTWLSLEQDFGLQAVHDEYGHVRVTVTLKGPNAPPAWTVSPEITTDPGAQMTEAAETAARLLAARA